MIASALTVRFITRRFIWEYDPTLEMTYRHRTFFASEMTPVDFEILDTAGQENKTEDKIKWADAYIIVYSINDRCSFNEVMRSKFLITRARKNAAHDPAILIIGNKSDLERDRLVDRSEGEQLANALGCGFNELSVCESFEDVHNAFEKLYIDYKCKKKLTTPPIFARRRKLSAPKQDTMIETPKPRQRSTSFFSLSTGLNVSRPASLDEPSSEHSDAEDESEANLSFI
ncbi:ras-related and estrogen-regulated growth inhibitor-like isoform X2 [Anneissia japonica]|uniref:ras-related and estrogen-regulated growth inhibitor-like isoform X2 n=1 Tax=Anneissia japonica TaxID=1529436 RepID=UPI0014258487|nr:ras-related and estrogen-regulated growth inhibitor-like isoform X2 [Anneissia japonica]